MRALFLFVLLGSSECLDGDALRVIRNAGYRDVHIRVVPARSECADASDVREFTAYDKNGDFAHGLVCCKYDFGCILVKL